MGINRLLTVVVQLSFLIKMVHHRFLMVHYLTRWYVQILHGSVLGQETEVPPSLLSLPSPRTQKPAGSKNQVVVLTGATGQLGGALLKAIVEDANVTRVHCIGVRDAVNRKEDIGFELNGKVTLHADDLYQHRLGLSDDDADRIFAEATIIVHSAADK